MNMDRMQYFVLCQYKSGLSWAERDPANMDRKNTIEDICSGELPDVVMVLECNPVEIICRDVTEDILADAGVFVTDDPPRLSGQDSIDWQRDRARDERKVRV
jgi:hypothetical protein